MGAVFAVRDSATSDGFWEALALDELVARKTLGAPTVVARVAIFVRAVISDALSCHEGVGEVAVEALLAGARDAFLKLARAERAGIRIREEP